MEVPGFVVHQLEGDCAGLSRTYSRETPCGCLSEDSEPREVVPNLDSISSDMARGMTNECVGRVH